jgi:hypothetical protein
MNFDTFGALAQRNVDINTGAAAGMGIFGCFVLIIELALVVAAIAGMWKVFEKAGKPGWAAIIPIYNLVILLEIVGRPIWWIVLFLIPCVNIVMIFIVAIDVAKSYGQTPAYGIGLALLPFVFYPMLGFGPAQYVGPAAAPGGGGPGFPPTYPPAGPPPVR